MNPEIEFNCPVCSQSLRVDANARGMLVVCPACTKQIEVPGPRLVYAQPPPIGSIPVCTTDYDRRVTIRTRNCVMGYVSLGLVCLSLVSGGILLLPGLVCGHIALGQCKQDPGMTGRSSAVAALIVGYSLVGLVLLIFIAFASMKFAGM